MSDPVHGHYRTKEEVQEQKEQDPIRSYAGILTGRGIIDQAALNALDRKAREVTDQAIQFADASPEPSPEALFEDVYSMPYGPFTRSEQ
jgi:pyruvate dehydrogenase E1 component alpha subunit